MLCRRTMDEDRPHAPSARKLRRAREAGDVAKSPLASSALVLLAGGAALAITGPVWIGRWEAFAVRALSGQGDLREAGEVAAAGLVWPLGACVAVGALAGFLQVGPLWTSKPLSLDLGRLNPARGLREMFQPAELGARLLPAGLVFVLGLLALAVLRDSTGLYGRTVLAPEAALSILGTVLGAFYWRACAVIALAGALALVYRRYRYWRDQHMSRREVQREQRELEGQPAARRRRAQRHEELVGSPTLTEVLARSALIVRGGDVTVLVAWADRRKAPTVSYVARGGVSAALSRSTLSTPGLVVAQDDALARELSPLAIGAQAPRGTWRRLARWLAGSSP